MYLEHLKLDIPSREAKPRQSGISNLVDNGYGLKNLADVLELCHPFVDIVKLGWASMALTNNLLEKVELFKSNDIETCPGGMMFEISYWQNRIKEFEAMLRDFDITMVEVSNGSMPIPEKDKLKMVDYFASKGFKVLSEVGSKDVTAVSPPEYWLKCIADDLEAGAWKVIVEGRADASAGVYNQDGSVKDDLIEAFLSSRIPTDKLVFEAPHKRQVAYFVNRIGPNVNIGNIPLGEALNVECLRVGLRGDTVDMHLE